MSERTLNESVFQCKDMISQIYEDKTLKTNILEVANVIKSAIKKGNKVLFFGNGGSAADAQHIAAEFIGKFKLNRKSFHAIALTDNSSIITSVANDFAYDEVFSRQCEAIVKSDDVVIGISTSGNSKNVQKGIIESKKKNAITVGLLGSNGGVIGKMVDVPIIVKSTSTPKIQEVHRVLSHIICEEVERNLAKKMH